MILIQGDELSREMMTGDCDLMFHGQERHTTYVNINQPLNLDPQRYTRASIHSYINNKPILIHFKHWMSNQMLVTKGQSIHDQIAFCKSIN